MNNNYYKVDETQTGGVTMYYFTICDSKGDRESIVMRSGKLYKDREHCMWDAIKILQSLNILEQECLFTAKL
jgi:hypothetical protein